MRAPSPEGRTRGGEGVLQRLLGWWATRSLGVGAVATVVDVAVLLVCVKLLKFPNPLGAACGVAVGSTLTFVANRVFAFRDHSSPVGPQFARFAASTAVAMGIHATLVGVLADRFGVNVVIAKLISDVLVFSVGQLFILRFVVFKRRPPSGMPLR